MWNTNKFETIYDEVLNLMIALKLYDNMNEITTCVAQVGNDSAVVAPISEDNGDVIFLSNINLIETNINNNNSRSLAENNIEEGLQTESEVELKSRRKSALLLPHRSNNQWNNQLEQ